MLQTGMTDGDYLAIFYQIILPVAMEYNPDVVIVSAGYDCALGCPEVVSAPRRHDDTVALTVMIGYLPDFLGGDGGHSASLQPLCAQVKGASAWQAGSRTGGRLLPAVTQ